MKKTEAIDRAKALHAEDGVEREVFEDAAGCTIYHSSNAMPPRSGKRVWPRKKIEGTTTGRISWEGPPPSATARGGSKISGLRGKEKE